jgi:hypothetical protein
MNWPLEVSLKGAGCPHGCEWCNILLFVDNCAAQTSGTPFLTNAKVVYYPPNATSMLQPLDLGTIKVFQALVWEAPSTKPCAFNGLGTGH